MKHGDKSPGNAFIELTELNEQLSKPFHLLYSGSKVCFQIQNAKVIWITLNFICNKRLKQLLSPMIKNLSGPPTSSVPFHRYCKSICLASIITSIATKRCFPFSPYYHRTRFFFNEFLPPWNISFSVISVWKMRSQLLLFSYGWEPAQCDKASGLGFVPRAATGSMENFYRYALMSRRRTAGIIN